MKILQTIALTGLITNSLSIAVADTTLIFADANSSTSMKMQITGSQMRATSTDDDTAYMTYDSSSKTFTSYNVKDKEYYIMGEKEIATLGNMDAMVEKILAEQLSEMPEAQRAMMRGMMEEMVKSQLPKPAPKPAYTLTERSASYMGFDCQIVTKKSSTINAEFCVTNYKNLGMASDEYAVINSFQQTISSLAQQFGGDQSMDFSHLGQFIPVQFDQEEQSGTLSEVNHDKIDPSVFAIPDDYTEIDLPF